MSFRGGEFSTGTMGNFQPELTGLLDSNNSMANPTASALRK
jgi:hypothetical protein